MTQIERTETGDYILAYEDKRFNIQEVQMSPHELLLLIQDAFDCKVDFKEQLIRFHEDYESGVTNYRIYLHEFISDISDTQFEEILSEFLKQKQKMKL